MRHRAAMATWLVLPLALIMSCGDDRDRDDNGGTGLTDQTGQSCRTPDDCYQGINDSDIQGEIQCLDRVEGGYCTHLCTGDEDCCAVERECPTGVNQVCAPFESTGLMMCFISCEDEDVGGRDPTEYCRSFHRDFICRSTGGGHENRKVCVPGGGGALCTAMAQCPVDWPNCCEDSFGDYRCYNDADASGRNCLP